MSKEFEDEIIYPDARLVRETARRNIRSFVSWCGTNLEFEDPILDMACGFRNNRPEIDPSGKRKFFATDLEISLKPDFVANVFHLPIADQSVGCALCTEMLEHVPEPEVLLREVKRVLKPHGLLIVTVPFWVPIHEKEYYQLDYWRFTPRGLYYLLLQDFTDIHVQQVNQGLFPINVLAHAKAK